MEADKSYQFVRPIKMRKACNLRQLYRKTDILFRKRKSNEIKYLSDRLSDKFYYCPMDNMIN